jgi:hypothetical protein
MLLAAMRRLRAASGSRGRPCGLRMRSAARGATPRRRRGPRGLSRPAGATNRLPREGGTPDESERRDQGDAGERGCLLTSARARSGAGRVAPGWSTSVIVSRTRGQDTTALRRAQGRRCRLSPDVRPVYHPCTETVVQAGRRPRRWDGPESAPLLAAHRGHSPGGLRMARDMSRSHRGIGRRTFLAEPGAGGGLVGLDLSRASFRLRP